MGVSWFRVWHELPVDPKWRVIAKKSNQKVAHVISVYMFMLASASQNHERGLIGDWDDEDVAAALDLETEDVAAIREAMQGKVLEGERVTGWEKRQPLREDDSRSRQQESRKRRKEAQCHTMSHNVTRGDAPDTDTDTDTDTENTPHTPQGGPAERKSSKEEDQALLEWYEKVFNWFWGKYPPREGSSKKKARESFEKCFKGLKTDEERKELAMRMAAGVDILKESKQWQEEKTDRNWPHAPHAVTYLNQCRWESVPDALADKETA